MAEKDFSRIEYRRSDAWPSRIRREWPFIEARLREAPPAGVVLDLGCGSGEHARFIASRGHATAGVDRSGDALRMAAEATPPGAGVSWARADLRALPFAAGTARLALCLGNTIAILGDDPAIERSFAEARRVLAPGGVLVLQALNYHKLRSEAARHLPLDFRRQEGDAGPSEFVYLRLLDFEEPDHVGFHVLTIERFPGRDEVEVRHATRRRLRSIEHDRIAELLRHAGFNEVALHGDYAGAPFEPQASTDVIAVAK